MEKLAKYNSRAAVIAILLGGLFFYAGDRLNAPFFTNLGIACFGLFVLIQGAQTMISRQASFIWGQGRKAELAAQLWGGIFIAFAGLILFVAVANFFLPGGISGYMDRMLSHPFGWGLLLSVAGIFALVYGTVNLLTGGQRPWSGVSNVLSNLRDWLAGAFVIAAGLLLGLIGLGLALDPQLLSAIGATLLQVLLNVL